MNFKRKQRIKGRTAKTYKEWYSDCHQYRISWRSEVFDVSVAPGYHACVRSGNGWGFARRRGLYKTLKAAKDACAMNWKLWNAFLAIEGRGKVTQVRNLIARAMVGRGTQAYSGMADLPVWVREKSTPRLLEILQPRGKLKEDEDEEDECASLSDPIRVWKNTDGANGTLNSSTNPSQQNGPASNVEGEESVSPPNKLTTSGSPLSTPKTPAQGAKGPAKAKRKKSSKLTAKSSSRGTKKSRRGKKKKKT